MAPLSLLLNSHLAMPKLFCEIELERRRRLQKKTANVLSKPNKKSFFRHSISEWKISHLPISFTTEQQMYVVSDATLLWIDLSFPI